MFLKPVHFCRCSDDIVTFLGIVELTLSDGHGLGRAIGSFVGVGDGSWEVSS